MLRRRLRFAVLAITVVGAASPTAALADPFTVQATWNDGAPFRGAWVCDGAGCTAAGDRDATTGADGRATVHVAPGTTVEVAYRTAYRLRSGAPGTWTALTATSGGTGAASFGQFLTPGANPEQSANESRFVELVNAARGQNGLQPVAADAKLTAASDQHVAWMRRVNLMDHVGEYGSSFGDRAADYRYGFGGGGEIIFLRGGSAQSAFDGFMNSPGHRGIILTPDMRYIGVGNVAESWSATFTTGDGNCAGTSCGAPSSDGASTQPGPSPTPAAPPAPTPVAIPAPPVGLPDAGIDTTLGTPSRPTSTRTRTTLRLRWPAVNGAVGYRVSVTVGKRRTIKRTAKPRLTFKVDRRQRVKIVVRAIGADGAWSAASVPRTVAARR